MRIITNKEAREETQRRKLDWSLVQDVKRDMQYTELLSSIAEAENIQDIKSILYHIAEQLPK